jgi:NADH-quinone oxidoreductase subunit L
VHLLIGVVSALLGVAGIALAMGKYKNKSSEALLHAQPSGTLAQLSYNHFYLDAAYDKVFVRPVLWMARMLYRLDKRVIDYGLEYASKWLVVFSKIVKWFDKWVVDGSVWMIGAMAKVLGRFGRSLQNGKVQSYYAYSLFGFILVLLYIMLN